MVDRSARKPANWEDRPTLPDPDAVMPEDWDEEEDGEWQDFFFEKKFFGQGGGQGFSCLGSFFWICFFMFSATKSGNIAIPGIKIALKFNNERSGAVVSVLGS